MSNPCLVCSVGNTRTESIEVDLDTIRSPSAFLHDAAHTSEEVGDPAAALDADIIKPDETSVLVQFIEKKLKTVMDGFAVL